jgi:cytoskeletal protein CcmA (bactofilin family)
MVGEIIAETNVTIHKNAVLEGDVTAKAITVEKGGVFSGQLVIGRADFTQAELLPEQKPAEASESTPEAAAPVAHPLPAT